MKNNRLFNTAPFSTDFAALLFRLILGGLMAYHGWQKVANYDTILPMFGDVIGIGSKLSLQLVIFAELVCGLLVLIGLFTRLALLPIFFTMAVAVLVAHAKDPFQVKELAFTFMTLSIAVFVLGAGRYSADAAIAKR